MSDKKYSPESVIMTDWATDDLSMGGSAKATVFELMLLSLLYDKVLIQDEVFALSDKCAKWFSQDKDLELLRKCFDLESLVILKFPLSAYPTDDLKELAQAAPIYARARYIQKYGTKAEQIFIPDESKIKLYHNIDAWLLNNPRAHRPVGELQNFDIMGTFDVILKEVLSSKLYKNWRESAFKGVTDKMADDFVGFIENPEKVIAKLRENNKEYKFVLGPDGKPIFNRSLGYLATTLYLPNQAKAMQRLIQTAFAAPFSWREKAAGRYSGFLRELLWIPAKSVPQDLEHLDKGELVSVEAHVDTQLPLPEINTDFVEAINSVRNTDAGKKLRKSMRQIENSINFNEQVNAWNEVAFELAKTTIKKKPIMIRTSAIQIGKDLVYGSVASGLLNVLSGKSINDPMILAEALLGGAIGVSAGHLQAVLCRDIKRQEFREKIEHAVKFRCSPIDIPPVALPVIKNEQG